MLPRILQQLQEYTRAQAVVKMTWVLSGHPPSLHPPLVRSRIWGTAATLAHHPGC
jgi:hypothetical protein